MPNTVCFDFDGVLSDDHGWPGEGHVDPPRPGLREILGRLRAAGYTLVVHTTRDVAAVSTWLEARGLGDLIDGVTGRTPPALVYLDDRAGCVADDYDAAFEAITTVGAYWEPPPKETCRRRRGGR